RLNVEMLVLPGISRTRPTPARLESPMTPAQNEPSVPGGREMDSSHAGGEYSLLFTSNPMAMWVFDIETLQFLAVNDAAVAKYGFSRDEFLGMTIADIRPPEDVPELSTYLKGPASELPPHGLWRHRRKDGTLL